MRAFACKGHFVCCGAIGLGRENRRARTAVKCVRSNGLNNAGAQWGGSHLPSLAHLHNRHTSAVDTALGKLSAAAEQFSERKLYERGLFYGCAQKHLLVAR